MRRWTLKTGAKGMDDLVPETTDPPEVGADEVRIRVRATSLNYRDLIILRGEYGLAIEQDLIPLSDGAGEIDAVGAEVTQWSPGDRVAGLYFKDWYEGPPRPQGNTPFGLGSPGQDGMLAEYVVLKADRVSRIPESLDFEQAATLPCAALTAWSSLFEKQPVKPGDKVAVLGTGGVSMFGLLFARAAGAEVIVTSSSDEKLARARELGASDGVNYRGNPNWGEIVLERTGGVQKIVNAAGAGTLEQSFAAIGAGGEIALSGLFDHGDAAPPFFALMAKGASIRGITVGGKKSFEDMVAAIDASGIKPPIGKTFAFDQAKEAYSAQAAGDRIGKIVVSGA